MTAMFSTPLVTTGREVDTTSEFLVFVFTTLPILGIKPPKELPIKMRSNV